MSVHTRHDRPVRYAATYCLKSISLSSESLLRHRVAAVNQRLTGQDGPYLLRLLLQKKSKDAEARRKHQQQGQEKAAGKRPASGAPKEPAKRANTAGE